MQHKRFGTTVSVETLAGSLGDESWVVVDVRYDLADADAGRRLYESSHIPGAAYADLGRDLSDLTVPWRGRHPLPSINAMAATFGRLGIDRTSQVIVYDAGDGMYASRLWWMLRYLGHDAVAVLDGGYGGWIESGLPVRSGAESRPARHFDPEPRAEMIVEVAEVEATRHATDRIIVDSRAPDRYRGENETIDPVAGHIPGALNRFYKKNVDDRGSWRAAGELQADFSKLLGGRAPSQTIVYCGSGVTACHNLLALEIAGLSGARLYPGSWSEWIADPSRPVATGAEP